jgi:DNA ligase-1
MKYQILAELYENLSATTKRLEKIDILSKFLKILPKNESEIIHLIQGNIYPDYDERKLGISEQLAIRSIAKSFGTTPDKVTNEWRKIGDLGEVAKNLCKEKKTNDII